MSDAAKYRAANKEKAQRLCGDGDEWPGSQSTKLPQDKLDADVKTGARPVSRTAFKKGGVVTGAAAKHHAGRVARASGGTATADAIVNRNVKEANAELPGKKHVGGWKDGGRAKKLGGGGLYGMNTVPTGKNMMTPAETKKKANGGGILGRIILPSEDIRRPKTGGPMQLPATKESIAAAEGATGAGSKDKPVQMIHSAIQGGGGFVPKDVASSLIGPGKNFEGMIRPVDAHQGSKMTGIAPKGKAKGGRTARAEGGRVEKGKTNINIIIAPQGGKQPPMPPMGDPPMPDLPPPPPPIAAGPPMGGPPAGLAAALTAGPPMGRATGGKVFPKMDAGAGGGLGRLEKIKEYGKNARP